MLLAKFSKDYILNNKDYILSNKVLMKYPFLYPILLSLFTAIYVLALYSCIGIIYEDLILPLLKILIYCINNIKSIILKMAGSGGGSSNNPNPSPNPNPSNPKPSPGETPSINTNDTNNYKNPKGKRNPKDRTKLNYECLKAHEKCHELTLTNHEQDGKN